MQSDTNREKCMETSSLQEIRPRGESWNGTRRAPHEGLPLSSSFFPRGQSSVNTHGKLTRFGKLEVTNTPVAIIVITR